MSSKKALSKKKLVDTYLAFFKVPSFYPGDKDDLQQVGMMGLLRAVETWDSTKSAFETWAWYWIRSAIRTEVRKFKYINAPHHDVLDPKTTAEIKISIRQITGKLDKKYMELLSRFLAGQNPVEIGRDWGISRQAVDQRIERMIKLMKEEA